MGTDARKKDIDLCREEQLGKVGDTIKNSPDDTWG